MKLKQLFLLLVLALSGISVSTAHCQNPAVEKVHIIFKTHLDVGFTDLSSKVEQRYVNDFIPRAIRVAEELRADGGHERYVWTIGSWLVWSFLEQASPEQVKKLEEAISHGDIAWNAVPYTIESESMNKEHFETILKLSEHLDKRFGKKTTAAKMTDVPGHTRGIVPLFDKAGIRFLHIGVNPASTVPYVPGLCRWRTPDGSEIILMYQKDYGRDVVFPDGKTAMVIAFTGDNHGPHSAQQVKKIYADIQKRYPNAELAASSLSQAAADIEKTKELLPVLTSEIGDTWIHGFGSSPIRMARFRALSRLYARWIDEKRLDPDSKEALNFAINLGLIAEHTWGLNVTGHLKHWDKYDPDVFWQARTLPEFQRIERSWQEVDAYIYKAIGYLPVALQAETNQALSAIGAPARQTITGNPPPKEITPEGALQTTRNGLQVTAGELSYQTFSSADFNRFHDAYLTNKYDWAIGDFGKLGLENSSAQSASSKAALQNCDYNVRKKQKGIACKLAFAANDGIDSRVFPKEMYANYTISPTQDQIEMSITLIDKPANRMPEAYWLSFFPEQITGIIVEKLGLPVDVLDVVEGGNRQLHGIDRYVDIVTTTGRIRITSLDALLVAIGERNLLNYSTEQPDIRKGIHFCLFNNCWGTNFSMWFEGSLTYRFKMEFLPL